MAGPTKTRRDDIRDLEILHKAEVDGLVYAQIGQRYGMTRSAVGGLIKRFRDAADDVPCRCRKLENRDGGMPARWWAK
jgi:transposase